jgi:hypothetical protein
MVQNNLTMLALLAAGNMADESGNAVLAAEYRGLAAKVRNGMEQYLVGFCPFRLFDFRAFNGRSREKLNIQNEKMTLILYAT